MSESEKFAVAAHLHVLIRRRIGRVTDTEWMVRNTEYALEVLRVARGEKDPEMEKLAVRYEELMAEVKRPPPIFAPAAASPAPRAAPGPSAPAPDEEPVDMRARYIRTLR